MLVVARVNAHEAQQEANYHIGAMESRYDTFKEEAQYLTWKHRNCANCNLQGQLHSTERLQQALRLRPRTDHPGTVGRPHRHWFTRH